MNTLLSLLNVAVCAMCWEMGYYQRAGVAALVALILAIFAAAETIASAIKETRTNTKP